MFVVGLIKLSSACSGFACYFLQERNSNLEMNGKHMQLSIQNPFYTLHSVREAILILRYFFILCLFSALWIISLACLVTYANENLLRLIFIFTWSTSFLGILVGCIIGDSSSETEAKFRAYFLTIPWTILYMLFVLRFSSFSICDGHSLNELAPKLFDIS